MSNSGYTTTSSLADSLPKAVAAARSVNKFEGVMPQLCDKKSLGQGMGNDWNEITMSDVVAQAVTESTVLDNPQQITDTMMTITPTVVAVETFISDKVKNNISKVALAQLGGQSQKAIVKKKDEDGLAVLDGATTSLCGAGSTLTSGHISAGSYRITSNATEPGNEPIYCVLHGFQIKDIADEITAGVGTYNVSEGLTARVFQQKFQGMIANAQIYEDGNIEIDSNDDAKGGVFAGGTGGAIVIVQGRGPRIVPVRRENVGGGGTSLYHYDEYAYGERSAGDWLFELYSDATAPTG